MRLHPATETIPKPLIELDGKPLLWHLMKYYSYYGHKDFILCLGYKGELIKRYFVNDLCPKTDFILSTEGQKLELLKNDTEEWKITFAETGLGTTIGQRLRQVKNYLDGEEYFLANYSDGLTDLNLPSLIDFAKKSKKIACFIAVKPFYVFHIISMSDDGCVQSICAAKNAELRINGGFFVFKNDIFDYIHDGEDLVEEPFQRLITEQQLVSYKYDGFWASLDTFKDKRRLDDLVSSGNGYWELWKR